MIKLVEEDDKKKVDNFFKIFAKLLTNSQEEEVKVEDMEIQGFYNFLLFRREERKEEEIKSSKLILL